MTWELAGGTLTTLLLAVAGVITAVGLWIRARAEAAPRHAAAEEKLAAARKAIAETRLIEARTRAADAEADRAREEASGRHLLSAVTESEQLRVEVRAARSEAHAANARASELEIARAREREELEVARAHDREECRVEIERANNGALNALDRAQRAEARCGELERSLAALNQQFAEFRKQATR